MDVYLIDGTYELFRHYFAVPSARDRDGREVGAVRGVLTSLLGMMRSGTYVGVATMGIASRLQFYAKPGSTQRTNRRLNQLIKTELATRPFVDIYTAMPGDLVWNGLPVHGSAGLELGLIQKYALPWNIRSAG